jgi:peptidoglycan/xylan/chitin deacetylase (PgdA/CDA1 family)
MYVNALPFGSAEGPAMLRDLAARGFELGNHTASHADLSSLSARGVKRELVLGKRVITGAVPKAEVRTMALPLGQKPDDPHLASNGSWGGTSYRHLAVMLVGAEPAPSPFSSLWKPRAVPRIRSSSWNGKAPNYGSEFWLDQLRAHPEDRYVSDGDPGVVSFPKALRRQLAARFQGSAVGY